MRNTLAVIVLWMMVPFSGNTQEVEWITMDQLKDSMAVKAKPVFFDLQTDWCGWCRKMEATTFRDSGIATTLNHDYYPVKFNAERKDSVFFAGAWFGFEPTGPSTGTHKLAKVLGENEGRMTYPTLAVVSTKGEIVLRYVGYAKADDLLSYLDKIISLEKNGYNQPPATE